MSKLMLSAVLFASFLSASPGAAADEMSADEKAIREIVEISSQGYIERDLDKILVQYDNAELMFFDLMPPMQDCCGAQRAREKLKQFMDGTVGPVISQFNDMKVHVDRDMAYTTAIYHFEFTGKDGKKYNMDARITDVWRRIDGKWSVVHEHCSIPATVTSWM